MWWRCEPRPWPPPRQGEEASRLRRAKIEAGSRDAVFYSDEAHWLLDAHRDAAGALAVLDRAERGRGAPTSTPQRSGPRPASRRAEEEASWLRRAKIEAGSRNAAFYSDEAKWLLDAHQDAAGALVLLDRAERAGCANEYTGAGHGLAAGPAGDENLPPGEDRGRQPPRRLLQRRGPLAAGRPPRRGGSAGAARPGRAGRVRRRVHRSDPGHGPGRRRAGGSPPGCAGRRSKPAAACRLLQRRGQVAAGRPPRRGGSAGGAGSGGSAGVRQRVHRGNPGQRSEGSRERWQVFLTGFKRTYFSSPGEGKAEMATGS